MALEFQVEVGDAQQKISGVVDVINKLNAALGSVDTSALDQIAQKSAAIKAPDDAVSEGVKKVGDTAKEAAPEVDKLADSLQKIKPSDGIDAAAEGIKKVTENAKQASEGAAGIDRLGAAARNLGSEASSSNQGLNALNQGLTSILGHADNVGGAISSLGQHFGQMPGLVGGASSAIGTFAEAAGGIPGVLIAVASAIAAIDWHSIAEHAIEASDGVEKLQRSINAFSKDAQAAPQALEMLDRVAEKTGFSLEGLEKSFGKYFSIAAQSGKSTETINKNFEAMTTAVQAAGSNLEKLPSLLNTMDTWMSRGTMTAGLLGRSLASVGLSMSSLLPEFSGLARNATLPMSAMDKLLENMAKMKPAALTVADALQVLQNSLHQLSVAFGLGIKDTALNSINDLNHAISSFMPQFKALATLAGEVYGAFMRVANIITSVVVVAFGTLIEVVQGAWNILNALSGGALNAIVQGLQAASDAVSHFVAWVGENLQGAVSQTSQVLQGMAIWLSSQLVSAFKSAGSAALDFAKTLGSMALDGLVATWNALPDWLKGTLANAWSYVKNIALDAMDGIKAGWGSMVNWLKSQWQGWLDYYKANQPAAPSTPQTNSPGGFKPDNTPTNWGNPGTAPGMPAITNHDDKWYTEHSPNGTVYGGGGYRSPASGSGIASPTMDWGFGQGVNGQDNGRSGGTGGSGGSKFVGFDQYGVPQNVPNDWVSLPPQNGQTTWTSPSNAEQTTGKDYIGGPGAAARERTANEIGLYGNNPAASAEDAARAVTGQDWQSNYGSDANDPGLRGPNGQVETTGQPTSENPLGADYSQIGNNPYNVSTDNTGRAAPYQATPFTGQTGSEPLLGVGVGRNEDLIPGQEDWAAAQRASGAADQMSPALLAREAQAAAEALVANPGLNDMLKGATQESMTPQNIGATNNELGTQGGNDLARAIDDLKGTEDRGNDLQKQSNDEAKTIDEGEKQTVDAMAGLVQGVNNLETNGINQLDQTCQDLGNNLTTLGDKVDSNTNASEQNTQTCEANNQSLDLLSRDTTFNTDQTLNNTEADQQNTQATDAETAAAYADAAAQGSSGGGGGGGGGGQTDAQAQSGPGAKFGGVLSSTGAWSGETMSHAGYSWEGAKHFADGGITDGGIPIVAHPNEAVIPLKGGSIPVSMGNAIPQAVMNAREATLNVGTLAHNDAVQLLAAVKNLGDEFTSFSSSITSIVSSRSSGSSSTTAGGSGLTGNMFRDTNGFAMDTHSIGYGSMKDGGVVGRWTSAIEHASASAWKNAPHFADGGTTSGIPIIAHPDEAVIPMKSGAVPVSMGREIPQAIMNLREVVLNVGTLAHTDAAQLLQAVQKLDNDFLASFSILAATLQSSGGGGGSGSSGSSGSSSSSSSGLGSNSPSGGYFEATDQFGQPEHLPMGPGTSAPFGYVADYVNGNMVPGSAKPMTLVQHDLQRQFGMFKAPGPHPYGWGMSGPTGAAGIDNTSDLPGMGANGMSVWLHPDEAVVPLQRLRGGPINEHLPVLGGRGGSAPPTINIVYNAPPHLPFGRGPSPEQTGQKIASEVAGALRRIGSFNKLDDPTLRNGLPNPGAGSKTRPNSF